jgi:hypothetical protein
MTYQGDLHDPRRSQDYIDRAPSSSSALPIIGGIVALGVLTLLIFSFAGDRTGDPVIPRSPGATAPTTAPPANKPPPAPSVKPQ